MPLAQKIGERSDVVAIKGLEDVVSNRVVGQIRGQCTVKIVESAMVGGGQYHGIAARVEYGNDVMYYTRNIAVATVGSEAGVRPFRLGCDMNGTVCPIHGAVQRISLRIKEMAFNRHMRVERIHPEKGLPLIFRVLVFMEEVFSYLGIDIVHQYLKRCLWNGERGIRVCEVKKMDVVA